MLPLPASLLHGLVPVHGPLGTALDLAAFLALLLTIFGLVLLFEDDPAGRRCWGWAAVIVLVPVVGPLAYLYRRASDGSGSAG